MKIINIILAIVLFSLAVVAALPDINPTLIFNSNIPNNTTTTTPAVLTAVATDSLENAGISWIQIYENNNLMDIKNCNGVTTCIFTKTIVKTIPGTYTYFAKTSDLGAHEVTSNAITIIFNLINNNPVITSYQPNTEYPTVNEDSSLDFSVVATDSDNDPLSYQWYLDNNLVTTNPTYTYNAPSVMSVNEAHVVNVIVNDGRGGTAVRVWNLNVNTINDAPVITNIPDQTTDEDTAPIWQIDLWNYASDEETTVDNLIYTIDSQTNSSLINCAINTNRFIVCGTPALNQNGFSDVTIRVTDPQGAFITDIFRVTVNTINDVPTLTSNIPNQTWDEDTNLTIDLSLYFNDVDGDVLTYSVILNPTNIVAQISGSNVTLTPNANWNGIDNIQLRADDGNGGTVDSNLVILTVNSINDAPILNPIGNFTTNENELLTFTISATDIENDPLTYSGIPLPAGAVFDSISGIFTWTPDFTQAGTYQINFSVSDASLMDSEISTVTVNNVNRAPQINTFSPASPVIMDENTTQPFSITYSDPDLDPLTVSWYLDNNLVATNVSSYDYYADFNSAGLHNVTVIVSDGSLEVSQPWDVTVNNVNRAPILQPIGNQVVNENQNLTIQLNASDPDNDSLIYGTDAIFGILDTLTGLFTWTPTFNDAGNYTVLFNVTDGIDIVSEVINIEVLNVNRAPIIKILNQTTPEDTNASLNLSNFASDPDLDPLTYFVTAENISEVDCEISNDILTIIPFLNWDGIASCTVEANDGNLTAPSTFFINVTSVNDAPIVTDIPDVTFNEDTYNNSIDLNDYVSDVEDPDSAITWTYSGNVNIIISIDANNIINFTAAPNWGGVEVITLTATDTGGLNAFDNVTVTVLPVNDPPYLITNLPDYTFNEDTTATNVFDLDNYFADIDNASLIYTFSGNVNIIVNVDLNNNVTFSSSNNWTGTENITFTASDGEYSISDDVLVTVLPVNDPPYLITQIPDVSFDEDTVLSNASDLDNFFADVDDSILNYSFSGNTNVNININVNNEVTFSAAGNWSGSELITFRATDSGGLFVEDNISVTVNPINDAPWIFPVIPNQTQDEDVLPWSLNLSAYENDVEDTDLNLNWSVSGVNVSLFTASFDPNLNIITFTPVANAFGTNDITLTLTDSGGLTVSQIITVTLNAVNDAPIVSGIPNITFSEDGSDSSLDLDNYVTDVDNTLAEIIWTATGNINIIVNIDNITHVVTFSALPNWNGQETITFTATDPGLLSSSQAIIVDVTPVNDAPVIISTPITIGTEGILYSYDVDATDVENDTLTYSLVTAPTGMTINSTGFIQWTPAYNQIGLNNVNVSVDDGNGGLVSQAFTIDVANVPPIFTSYLFELQGVGNTTANNVYISPFNQDLYLDGLRIFASSNEIVDWIINISGANDPWATRSDATSISRPSSCAYWNGTFNQCSGTPLTDGIYGINITITDFGGAIVSDSSKTITIDNTAPSITINNIQNGNYYNYSIIPSITITDLNGISSNSTYLDGSSYTGLPITDGSHILEVNATDIAGNLASVLISFTVDTIAPVVTIDPIITPTNISTQTIMGTFTDANIANITVNGVSATLGAGTYNASVTLVEGNNPINVVATDLANNVGTSSTSILLDTIAPITTDNSPGTWQNADFNVILTPTDSGSGINYTTYNLDLAGGLNGTSVSITTNGNHTIQYYSIDNAGNVESIKTAYALLDKEYPQVTNVNATPSTININQSTSIAATVTDLFSGISSVTANVTMPNGFVDVITLSQTSPNVYGYNYANTGINGTYQVRIIATDIAGNVNNTETTTFFVNPPITDFPPIITLNEPLNGTNFSDVYDVTFNFTVTDDFATTLNCSIYLDNILNQNNPAVINGTLTNFVINNIALGNHNWYVTCSDSVQQSTSETRTFSIVDTITPIVTIISPVNGSTLISNNVQLNFTVNEATSWTRYSLDGGAEQSATSGMVINITDGTHTINVSASDLSGNVGSSIITFTVDTKGTLNGYIWNSTIGNALQDATIQLKQNGLTINSTISDINGFYELRAPPGIYNVTVFKAGFYDSLTENVQVITNTITNLNVTLQPVITTGTLTGIVRNANNTIYNATVEITQNGIVVAQTETNTTGGYSLTLNLGTYNISITKPGFNDNSAYNFVINVGANTYDATLTQNNAIAGGITGTIYDLNTFTPIAGATINIYKSGTTNLVQIVKSNSNGGYIVNGLPTIDTYDLEAVATGYTTQTFATGIGVAAGQLTNNVDAFLS